MVAFDGSHFALFGLPERFALDTAALDAVYRAVQARVHPDRFAAAGDAQKRVAMQWATRANEAYQTLRDPLRRAVYLLHLRSGMDVNADAQHNPAMAPAFLMQQMAWREQIEQAVAAHDVHALDALAVHLRTDECARFEQLATWLDSGNGNGSGANEEAANAVRELMFIKRVADEIATQVERLEA